MSTQPHDSDVKALVRIAVVWDIPIACNRTSADYLITSPLLRQARRTNRRPLSGVRSAVPAPDEQATKHAGPAARHNAAPPVPGRHGSQSDQPDRFSVASAMPAAFHQRRASLTI